MHQKHTGAFAPGVETLLAIANGLKGWSDVGGLGPSYFIKPAAEKDLLRYLLEGKKVSRSTRAQLTQGRARMVNFFALVNQGENIALRPPCDFEQEVDIFLAQLKEQAEIWARGTFDHLDFSETERHILRLVIVKSAPALFYMGFTDAIPHSGQVSRLCTSMARALKGRPSEVLQAAIVGQLHDPKLHPSMDFARHNLATHPVNAAALAHLILQDAPIKKTIRAYFHDNSESIRQFSAGIIDALAVNDDSRFVQMAVVLPFFVKRVGDMYGPEVAHGLEEIMEKRLESDSCGKEPPPLPEHLHGCLSQIRLDAGLRGISRQGWRNALAALGANLGTDPIDLFDQLISGKPTELNLEQVLRLKEILATSAADQILKVEIPATTLLHHHQEVGESGIKAASALVIADPMMLSPHKVAAVYACSLLERLSHYVKSFDDNIRLLPRPARANGLVWQRAVLLSLVEAADRLLGSTSLLDRLKCEQAVASVEEDIEALRRLVLSPSSWGKFGAAAGSWQNNTELKLALDTLEAAYISVVNQYRESIYKGSSQKPEKFYPSR